MLEVFRTAMSREPAVLIGFIVGVLVLIADVADGTLALRDGLEALSPLLTGLFVRNQVYSPESVDRIRQTLGTQGDV